MVPQVFLSLSGEDDAFVEKVAKHLPDGLAFFYRKSFENGKKLLDAMEAGVNQASVFVFFASKQSIKSRYTNFEIDRARMANLLRRNFRILVFPLSNDVSAQMLPEWMRQYWIPKAGFNPRDIARQIRHVVTSSPIALPAFSLPTIGRGQLLDSSTQRLMSAVAETQSTPNVFLLAGIAGIGRRTFIRYFLQQTMPSLPSLIVGPELQLLQFADLADIYRALREQIESNFSLHGFENDLALFQSLEVEEQVAEVAKGLEYFANLGQAVFAATGSGLFEDRGNLKPWVHPLFRAAEAIPALKLCLISNRQFRDEDIRNFKNVIQINVPPLRDPDIGALMTAASTGFGITPISPNSDLIRAIGGHPDVAKAAVRLIAQRGAHILERDPSALFGIQDEILSENLDVGSLTDLQKRILCVLSWVPQLEGKLLEQVVPSDGDEGKNAFVGALENLILGCLILVSDNSFLISPAIRQMFRRKHGFGPPGLLARFSKVLGDEWDLSVRRDEFRSELFDAFIFMHALEGRALPSEFRNLLLPSTLEAVTRQTYSYALENDDSESYRRVTSWGRIALQMRMDEAAREEILANAIRAHIRLGEFPLAEDLFRFFERSGYRMTPFLRGFSLRRQEKYRDAIPYLREALVTRRQDRSAVQELALCYQKLGMRSELAELVREHGSLVERSASLLDFKIGMLLSEGNIRDAELEIRRLKTLPEDDGRSTVREAQILLQRDNDGNSAERLLSGLVKSNKGDPVKVRRWRAMAAAAANNPQLARQDIEFIRARTGRQALAQRLEVYFALAQRDYSAAERAIDHLGQAAPDDLLRARFFEARANDIQTPLAERELFKQQAAELRVRNRHHSEFEFE